jgi:hypothetical protein
MADLNIRFAMETLRSLAFGSIVAGYTGIGAPFEHPAIQITLQNLTDETLIFSMDGTNNHIKLPSNGYWVADITANKQGNKTVRIPTGTRFYVKRDGTPTQGTVELTVCYAG